MQDNQPLKILGEHVRVNSPCGTVLRKLQEHGFDQEGNRLYPAFTPPAPVAQPVEKVAEQPVVRREAPKLAHAPKYKLGTTWANKGSDELGRIRA